ncbi:MAG: hypothetical protein ABI629_07345 [bacterium]
MTQPVDSSILHEIVRIIDSRRKVPQKVIVKSKEYLLTYLEDHQRRLEEAMSRYDGDRLNMLYGQLASKIKYQVLRRVPARAADAVGLGPAKRASAKAAAKAAAPKAVVAPKKAVAAAKPKRQAAAKKVAPAKAKKATAPKAAKKVVAKAKTAQPRAVARAKKQAGGRR